MRPSTSSRSSSAGPRTAAGSSRFRWSSRNIPNRASATSARIGCRCTTAVRPGCTGSATKAARSIIAWPNDWESGSTSRSRSGRAGAAVLRDGADAGRARRAAARRVSIAPPDRDGEVRDGRPRGAGQLADRARRLRRAGRAPPRRSVRRSHGPVFAARRFSGLPFDVRHAAQEPDVSHDGRRHPADGGLLPRARRASGSSCR